MYFLLVHSLLSTSSVDILAFKNTCCIFFVYIEMYILKFFYQVSYSWCFMREETEYQFQSASFINSQEIFDSFILNFLSFCKISENFSSFFVDISLYDSWYQLILTWVHKNFFLSPSYTKFKYEKFLEFFGFKVFKETTSRNICLKDYVDFCRFISETNFLEL